MIERLSDSGFSPWGRGRDDLDVVEPGPERNIDSLGRTLRSLRACDKDAILTRLKALARLGAEHLSERRGADRESPPRLEEVVAERGRASQHAQVAQGVHGGPRAEPGRASAEPGRPQCLPGL